jgi:hypothetical protein
VLASPSLSAALLILCVWSAKPEKNVSGPPEVARPYSRPPTVDSAAGGRTSLEQAAKALADFRAEEAIAALERAKQEGPYERQDYIRLYELLGIAYGYLDKNEDALRAFDMLLALDAGRAISYTLSPKVTFLFEQARSKAAERPPPAIDLGWPLGLLVDEPIPIDIEVLSDPLTFLRKARIFTRVKGSPEYRAADVSLPVSGQHLQVEIPPQAAGSTGPELVDIYLVATDDRGNEVYQWGAPNRPREIPLRWAPPDPWYGKWWIWAIAGTVVAAGASAAVFAATRTPGPTINGSLRVLPE